MRAVTITTSTGVVRASGHDERLMDARRTAERPPLPRWLESGAAFSWRLLAILAAFGVVAYAVSLVWVVVLPLCVALLATTLLYAPVSVLHRHGMPLGAAAALVMLGVALVIGGALAAVAPSFVAQVEQFGEGIQQGTRRLGDLLAGEPFNVSAQELRDRLDSAIERLRGNTGTIAERLQSGAALVGEILTGLIIAVLLTFFFLKDGQRMWDWLLAPTTPERRAIWNELGHRIFVALGGYVRGIALVGLADALLIGLALVLIGVPLVLPLMLLTFFGAFLPLIGAFTAGLAAVLIALVSNGVVAALLVLGAIIIVQQVEGNLLYPLLMGRTVHLHPVVTLLALVVGGILAGIVGIFLAVPVAAVASVLVEHTRQGGALIAPESGSDEALDGSGAEATS